MKDAVIYARYSSDKQDEASIDAPGPGLPGVRRQQGLCCPGGVRR